MHKFRLSMFVLFIALFGVATLLVTSAQTVGPFVAIEAELGTNTGTARVVDDSNASGGRYLSYGATVVTPPDEPGNPSWEEAWASRSYDTIRNWYLDNTGINAAGLTDADLTPSGGITTTANNQVIENMLISGTVNVKHDNVTIRNSKIVRAGDTAAIQIPYTNRDAVNNFTVENVSLIGTTAATYTQALKATYAPVTARNVYISGFGGGIFFSNQDGDVIEYNMVENIKTHQGSHNTGFSTRGGDNKLIRRNWIEGSSSSALSFYPDARPIRYTTVEENLFDGGSYSFIGGDGKVYGPQSTYNRLINNLFTYRHRFGPITSFSLSVEGRESSGNYYLDGKAL